MYAFNQSSFSLNFALHSPLSSCLRIHGKISTTRWLRKLYKNRLCGFRSSFSGDTTRFSLFLPPSTFRRQPMFACIAQSPRDLSDEAGLCAPSPHLALASFDTFFLLAGPPHLKKCLCSFPRSSRRSPFAVSQMPSRSAGNLRLCSSPYSH